MVKISTIKQLKNVYKYRTLSGFAAGRTNKQIEEETKRQKEAEVNNEKVMNALAEITEEEINNTNSQSQGPMVQTQFSANPSSSSQNGSINHQLRIKFVNASGDEKELIIEYSE